MIFPSRSQLASKQITRTGRAEAVTKEGLAATLLPGRQPAQMGQRHSLRPVRPRSCPGPLRNGSLCCISTRMWALPFTLGVTPAVACNSLTHAMNLSLSHVLGVMCGVSENPGATPAFRQASDPGGACLVTRPSRRRIFARHRGHAGLNARRCRLGVSAAGVRHSLRRTC